MKRVKSLYKSRIYQSLLVAGVAMCSTGAQASITLTGGGDWDLGSIIIVGTDPTIPAPLPLLNSATASASVAGYMYYSSTTGYGNFNEYDSSSDGATVAAALSHKGFGYDTEAAAESGRAAARAGTEFNSTLYGSSSANATSTWSDWFVISGGTGIATASFASVLEGVMSSTRWGSSGYSLSIGYSTGALCDYWYNTCGEAEQSQAVFSLSSGLSGKGNMMLSQDIEGEFTFAYDLPFQLTATLQASASNGGMADLALVSLSDSVVLPQGLSLVSASGFYAQAVPEAESYAMMLAGLGLVGWAVRRRRLM